MMGRLDIPYPVVKLSKTKARGRAAALGIASQGRWLLEFAGRAMPARALGTAETGAAGAGQTERTGQGPCRRRRARGRCLPTPARTPEGSWREAAAAGGAVRARWNRCLPTLRPPRHTAKGIFRVPPEAQASEPFATQTLEESRFSDKTHFSRVAQNSHKRHICQPKSNVRPP